MSITETMQEGLKKLGSRWIQAKDEYKKVEQGLFDDLQQQVDLLTAKAQRRAKDEFTLKDRLFLKTLYQSLAAGGYIKGLPEASKLIDHYIGASGANVRIDSAIYLESTVVKQEMGQQKRRIASALRRGSRDHKDKSGRLVAEQQNVRLKYADNRFLLYSATQTLEGGMCRTTWSTDEHYDFEDFKGSSGNWRLLSKWSQFPMRGYRLKIYDGLSRYLVELNLAAEFDYYAEWEETWKY